MIAGAAILVTLLGCATVTRGSTDSLRIESEPPGARAQIQPLGMHCTTPCSVELKRKRDYVIEFQKEGYDTTRLIVESRFGGAGAAGLAGNVLIGGLIGMGVDAASGATERLVPNPVRALLLPSVAQSAAPPVAAALPEEAPSPPEPPATVPAAPAGANCIQPSVVDREACLGRLQLDMTKRGILALLGPPDGTSRDQTTLRYGDRYLKFDAAEKLTRISDRPL